MHFDACSNTHHGDIDFVNHSMVKIQKLDYLEWSITFQQNKILTQIPRFQKFSFCS